MVLAGLKSNGARFFCALAAATLLLTCLAVPTRADKRTDARDQFASAVKMRTMLEGYLEKDRSRSDYVETVAAFHRVYLITPDADDATSALIAEAELYAEMGKLYDPAYFKSAIAMYSFLMKQYPGSRYRGECLLSVAKIQQDDLNKSEDAEATYKEYLKLFPRSAKTAEVREALNEIEHPDADKSPAPRAEAAADRAVGADKPQSAAGPSQASNQIAAQTASRTISQTVSQNEIVDQAAEMLPVDASQVTPKAVDDGLPVVKDFKTWNSPDSARIVVSLGNTVEFKSARIASPERIYFDLRKAQIGAKVPRQPVNIQGGMLKAIRVAQNKPETVRLVLDVDGAKDYSAFLVANPYRLVIDLSSKPIASHAEVASAATPAPVGAPPSKAAAGPLASAKAAETLSVSANASASTTASGDPAALATSISKAGLKGAKPHPRATLAESASLEPPPMPQPNRDGERSLTRALGLKINRIVIDAGHGGHDTGTIGPHGLLEKDVCLDVALRLGNLIEQRLPGADVVYTRKDDTFVPLEERTQIANDAKADLFISIHANSSEDPSARGIETYYLNFATSAEAMEVAARENANSQESMHDLQDLIKKIARNDKIEESKDLAEDIQDSLTGRLQLVSRNERNRGVKKAPFVVLIGANMPSVLAEISFLSNPYDENLLRKGPQRERIAEGLYRGIAEYLESLNSLSSNKAKLITDNPVADTRLADGTLAQSGNPK
ncbi:MAG TPA: N-acetylmuramoyl-L-alanine amidase [Candidatus Acidoferrales bacterium]|jgi:N-acetylmuramoyl-L-alanine amidase|nr:N-acetylmuramoyl-L-alanine amidase [Candidatus Acidoferrales bacterium]